MGDYSEWHPCLFSTTEYLGGLGGLRLVNQFIHDQIQHRLKDGPDQGLGEDMLYDFMPYAMSEPDPEKAHRSLQHLCETNILPGADTTATAMCAAILFLSRHPNCTEKLRKELQARRTAENEGKGDCSELGSLPYLRAVVKETMRLHPPIGLQNPRVVPEGGTMICGHQFAGGVSYATSLIAKN